MGRNPILIGKAIELTPRYFVQMDEGKGYFESGEQLLEFLKNNDPIECGCDLLSPEEWKNIEDTRLA